MTGSPTGTGARADHASGSVLGAVLAGFVLSLAAVALTSFAGGSEAGPVQPIRFNHNVHVEEQGLECKTCHPKFESSRHSGMPSARSCMLCHSEAQGETAEEARLVALLEQGAPLEWQSIYGQESYVYYSHRRHVVTAGIECETCHEGISNAKAPPAERRALTMDDCIDCHEDRGASTDCTACHR